MPLQAAPLRHPQARKLRHSFPDGNTAGKAFPDKLLAADNSE